MSYGMSMSSLMILDEYSFPKLMTLGSKRIPRSSVLLKEKFTLAYIAFVWIVAISEIIPASS